jgi:DNA-binding MarR family transcriptional regulator
MSDQLRAYQNRREMNVVFVHSELDDRNLTSAEFRVYCHLARRAGDAAAFPGIDSVARICCLSKGTVIKSIRNLEKTKLILTEKKPGMTTRYILTSKSEWAPLPNLNTPETVPNEVTGESKPGNATVPNEVTKGNPIKVIQLRRPATEAQEEAKKNHKRFIELWHESYKLEFQRDYAFNGGKDGSAVKRLLSSTKKTPMELIQVAKVAWKNGHLFNCKSAVDIAGFQSRWNHIVPELEKLRLLPKETKTVAGGPQEF